MIWGESKWLGPEAGRTAPWLICVQEDLGWVGCLLQARKKWFVGLGVGILWPEPLAFPGPAREAQEEKLPEAVNVWPWFHLFQLFCSCPQSVVIDCGESLDTQLPSWSLAEGRRRQEIKQGWGPQKGGQKGRTETCIVAGHLWGPHVFRAMCLEREGWREGKLFGERGLSDYSKGTYRHLERKAEKHLSWRNSLWRGRGGRFWVGEGSGKQRTELRPGDR